jgi:hypothetical protein
VEVKKVAIPKGEETFILCRTSGRKEKEKAIRNRFSGRMEEALKRLAKTIETGRLKDRHKMERRLGRIQARHSQVNDLARLLCGTRPRAFVFTGRLRKIGRFGVACGRALICCAPISKLAQPKNSGLAICS